jgi:sugar lactone lactonase YvrE
MAIRLRKVNKDTRTTVNILESDGFAASANVHGIAVSANGTVYGADFANHIVYKIYEDGRLLGAIVGSVGVSGDQDITTLGNNTSGTDGNDARLNVPFGICVDASDNIYVSDNTNRKVKRLSPHGRCITLAGSGGTGNAIGDSGASVTFGATMSGICVDKAGVVYLADRGNHKIKKIWSSGKTRTLAGNVSGFHNANGNQARFNDPMDCCVDRAGNVYVADRDNHCIRKVNENGDVSILAGGNSGAGTTGFINGDATTARFNNPIRVAMDPSGQFMYVLDDTNHAIRKVTTSGMVTTFMHFEDDTQKGDIDVDNSGFLYVLEKV